jgi:hypothetical protein
MSSNELKPYPANLGSRPARTTGEGDFNQRVDGDFFETTNKYGEITDVSYHMGRCRNPDCGEIGQIFRMENDLNICVACFVVQNDGIPEGNGKMSNRAKKRLNDKLKYECLHTKV